VSLLPRRHQSIGTAVVVGGLFAAEMLSLGLVAERFYA
jgi:hypothetical protein